MRRPAPARAISRLAATEKGPDSDFPDLIIGSTTWDNCLECPSNASPTIAAKFKLRNSMSLIVKCNSVHAGRERMVTVEAPIAKGTVPVVGRRAFVWSCETSDGEGLVLRGTIRQIDHLDRRRGRLTIETDGNPPHLPLGKADLLPYRSVRNGEAISGLAEKLYYHSLTRIVGLTPEETDFLDARF